MEIETSKHLFQPTLYRSAAGTWHSDLLEAIKASGQNLHWDEAALLGILSWGYVSGDRTLVHEVKRRPWLSEVKTDGTVVLEQVPNHGTHLLSSATAAEHLIELLEREVLRMCTGTSKIYLLLSGGLDSRIVAGVVARLADAGRLEATPIAVTWGVDGSRDVVIASEVAKRLGFEWQHVPLGSNHVHDNLGFCARFLGAQVAPHHLHRMSWFESKPRETLVLAASYGDSVGRAEFSRRHVLELTPLRPGTGWALLRHGVWAQAVKGVQADLIALRRRSAGRPAYALNECEMQGHYMRNMIAYCMGIIDRWCKVYQMFSDPYVYSFVWSLHPAVRTNAIYAEMIERLGRGLARLPWARTGRALAGRTEAVPLCQSKDFHNYSTWVTKDLYDKLRPGMDPNWFEQTGLFNKSAIVDLDAAVRRGDAFFRGGIAAPYDLWLWLAALRQFAEEINKMGCRLSFGDATIPSDFILDPTPAVDPIRTARRVLLRTPKLKAALKSCRRSVLRVVSLIRYPPKRPRKDIGSGNSISPAL